MNFRNSFLIMVLSFLFPFTISCGSSSSSDSTDDSGDTAGAVTVTDMAVLPNLDLASADTTSASFSLTAPPRSAVRNADVGSTSSAGCMAMKFFKPQALNGMAEAEVFKCFPETTQAAVNSDSDSTNDLTIPTGSFGYYQVMLPTSLSEQIGVTSVKTRMGNFTSGGTTTFKMFICTSTDDSTYTPNIEMNISGNSTDLIWSGFVTKHNADSFDNSTFSILMNSAADFSTTFDFANVASLTTVGYFGRDPSGFDETANDVDSDTVYSDGFRLNFGYWADASTFPDFTIASTDPINQTIGSFAEATGEMSGLMYALFDAQDCAAKMTFESSGESTFEDTEACDVTADPPTVVDASFVSFYADVAALTLPDSISVPDEVNTNTAFTDAWDCTAPSGSSFTEIDGSAIDYSACTDISSDVQDVDSSECFEGGGGGGSDSLPDLSGNWIVSSASGSCISTGTPLTVASAGSNSYSTSSGPISVSISVSSSTACAFVANGSACGSCTVAAHGSSATLTMGSCGDCASTVWQK